MSDIKNLIKAKSHDPYREFEIVSYLTCIENAHKAFFKFMAEQGYELYKKKDYLRKTISDFAKKLKHDIKEQDFGVFHIKEILYLFYRIMKKLKFLCQTIGRAGENADTPFIKELIKFIDSFNSGEFDEPELKLIDEVEFMDI